MSAIQQNKETIICPACSAQLNAGLGFIRCPECGLSFNDAVIRSQRPPIQQTRGRVQHVVKQKQLSRRSITTPMWITAIGVTIIVAYLIGPVIYKEYSDSRAKTIAAAENKGKRGLRDILYAQYRFEDSKRRMGSLKELINEEYLITSEKIKVVTENEAVIGSYHYEIKFINIPLDGSLSYHLGAWPSDDAPRGAKAFTCSRYYPDITELEYLGVPPAGFGRGTQSQTSK